MNRFLLLLLSVLFFNISVKAQDRTLYNSKFSEGNYLILEENYPQALKSFQEAYNIDSTNSNINYKIGFCYIKTEATKNRALKYLEKAVKNTTKNYDEDAKDEKVAPVTAYYYYGLALHLNYKFDEAIANYTKFKTYLVSGKHNALIKDADRMIEISAYAKKQVEIPTNYIIKNLGDSINSSYPDYSAVISADENTLIFTSRRPGSTGGDFTFEGDYFEDIYISHRKKDSTWETPRSISPFINTDEHEASVGLIADGQTLLIYKNPPNGGDIFESHLQGNDWTLPMPLEGDINSSRWEPSASLSPDGNTLYFVSDRSGGLGGRDIWTCVKLPNGKWSKATNLGAPVNTEYDEDSPFIDAVNDVLFFSSKGHSTMGGFDVFFANKKNDKEWQEPTNIGYPINTVDDDVYYTTSPDGKRGYFTSSLRAGGFGEKDIYMASSPEKKEDVAILVKGHVIPAPGDPIPSDIEITTINNESGLLYTSKVLVRDGSFIFILPPKVKFLVSYQQSGQEFLNEEWGPYDAVYQEIKKDVNLQPAKNGQALTVVAPENKNKLTELPRTANLINADGVLFDGDCKPYANKKVNLVNSKGEIVKTTTTNANGAFIFTKLPSDLADDYTVTTEDAGMNFCKKSKITFRDNKNKIITSRNLGVDAPVVATKKDKGNSIDYISAEGVVYDDNCKPYANKKIDLVNGKGEIVKTVTTNSKGGFIMTKLEPADDYLLKAEDPEIHFCNKSKITFKDKNNKVLNSKNFGSEPVVAAKKDTPSTKVDIEKTHVQLAKVNHRKFEMYFKYNIFDTDVQDEPFKQFVSNLEQLYKESGQINFNILACASQVPTKKFATNKDLATARADKMKEQLTTALKEKGIEGAKINFVKVRAIVGGPTYNADCVTNKAEYEKYQFVKVSAY